MNFDKIYKRVEATKKLKSTIDDMKLGCVCDIKSITEDEVAITLSFKDQTAEHKMKVIKGFSA